jgi:23S rRNA pseudouridine955/2504/2580 synthase
MTGLSLLIAWLAMPVSIGHAADWVDERTNHTLVCRANFSLAGYEPLLNELGQVRSGLNDLLKIEPPKPRDDAPSGQKDRAFIKSITLYEDDDVLVLNKPMGLAVQGGSGTYRHLDGMLGSMTGKDGQRPRLVHRLDKDTSGVLLIARTAAAAAFFTRAFREKTTRKTYWAAVIGQPRLLQGRIDLALAKHAGPVGARGGERVQADDEDGKSAVTYYRVIDHTGGQASWLALLPITGRTHQLRAHCAALGTPIIGDGKYGASAAHLSGVVAAKGLHLHARELVIPSPAGGLLRVTAPLPPHMRETWDLLGFAGDAADPFAELETPR